MRINLFKGLGAAWAGLAILLGCQPRVVIEFAPASATFLSCTRDGQINCITTENYKAVDSASLAENIPAGKILAGIEGTATKDTAPLCAEDGQDSCKSTAGFLPADISNLTNKIVEDMTVAGILGIAAKPPRQCNRDGDGNCMISGAGLYAASVSVLVSSHLKSGVTLAAITGSVPSSPLDCAADAGTDCVANSDFPAVNLALLDTTLYKNSLTIANKQGQLVSCAFDGDHGCIVDTANFKAALLSNFAGADIRSGKTLAGVGGSLTGIPSTCQSTGQTSCLASNLFPALDLVNNLQGNLAKIHSSVNFLGSTGSLLDCSSDGATACRTTVTYPSVVFSNLQANAAKFRQGLSIAGVAGTLANCGSDGSSQCYANGTNYKAALLANVSAANIRTGISVAGVVGSATEAPVDCSSDGGTNCVASSLFPAVDKANIITPNVASFHKTLTLGGVTGTLDDCSGDNGISCLTTSSYPAVDKSKAVGSRYLPGLTLAGVVGTIGSCGANGASDCFIDSATAYKSIAVGGLNTSTFLSSLSIAGSSGAIANCGSATAQSCYVTGLRYAGANCSSDGSQSCLAAGSYYAATTCAESASKCYVPTYVSGTQGLKAISFDSITAAVIKNASTLAGVTGQFPSSTYPLSRADSNVELINFYTQIANSSSFGWFDRAGNRYTGAGDADLVADNLLKDVQILGVTGNQVLPTNPWNVKAGMDFGASGVGKLRYNCRNWVKSSVYNYDGSTASNPSGLGTTAYTTGTLLDVWDTVDDSVGYSSAELVWDTRFLCGGTTTDASDDNVWLDVTTTGGTGCNASFCAYKDKISERIWSKQSSSSYNWSQAMNYCDNLSSEGGGWRLPTQKEFMEGMVHGLSSIANANFISSTSSYFWTSSTRTAGGSGSEANAVTLYGRNTDQMGKGSSNYVLCVK